MAFAKSGGNSRPTQLGSIVWNSKDETLPTPNIRFYDSTAKKESHLIERGEQGQPQVYGVIRKFSCSPVVSFTDRKAENIDKETGQYVKQLWRGYVTLDNGPNEPLAVLAFDLVDQSTKKVNRNGLDLLNQLVAHAKLVESEQLTADTPVMLGLYRNDRGYNASTLRLPSALVDGVAEFKDAKNTVKTEALPPKGVEVIVNGEPLKVNGQKVYDESAPIAWAEENIGFLLTHYKTHGEVEGEDEAAADAERVAEGTGTERPRMSA